MMIMGQSDVVEPGGVFCQSRRSELCTSSKYSLVNCIIHILLTYTRTVLIKSTEYLRGGRSRKHLAKPPHDVRHPDLVAGAEA